MRELLNYRYIVSCLNIKSIHYAHSPLGAFGELFGELFYYVEMFLCDWKY